MSYTINHDYSIKQKEHWFRVCFLLMSKADIQTFQRIDYYLKSENPEYRLRLRFGSIFLNDGTECDGWQLFVDYSKAMFGVPDLDVFQHIEARDIANRFMGYLEASYDFQGS